MLVGTTDKAHLLAEDFVASQPQRPKWIYMYDNDNDNKNQQQASPDLIRAIKMTIFGTAYSLHCYLTDI